MRKRWAAVSTVLMSVLISCSFIYNPDHINRMDDGHVIDVEPVVDVDPTRLNLDYVFPDHIYEGAGQLGARPALLVVRGEEIAPNAVVTVATDDPTMIHVEGITIAGDHNWIAISISAPLQTDAMHKENAASVPITITVDNGGGHVMTTTAQLMFLDELTAPPTTNPVAKTPGADVKLYSSISWSTAWTVAAGSGAAALGRFELHSVSGISITNNITMNGGTITAGPGGCTGGTGPGVAGNGTSNGDAQPCASGMGVAAGVAGNPGGYGSASDIGISKFAAGTPGGGGGGGGTLINGVGGGTGGGGAGMLELEALGDLTITGTGAPVTATGGAGGNGGLGYGGGGGAGGTIVLRSGHAIAVTSVVTTGGAGGGGAAGTGTTGGVGHVRFDAATGSVAGATFHGPAFQTAPYFSYDQLIDPTSVVITGPAGDSTFSGQVFDKDKNSPSDGHFVVGFSGSGTASPAINLTAGYNRVCAIVPMGNVISNPESGNCVEIAYLPGPHS